MTLGIYVLLNLTILLDLKNDSSLLTKGSFNSYRKY